MATQRGSGLRNPQSISLLSLKVAAKEVRSTSQLGRSRTGIFGVISLIIGLNMCMGLIFYPLAGGGGPLGLERALFGTGILLIFIGMGVLLSYLIFRLTRTRSKE